MNRLWQVRTKKFISEKEAIIAGAVARINSNNPGWAWLGGGFRRPDSIVVLPGRFDLLHSGDFYSKSVQSMGA
jgi:hypothetical protein